VIGACLDEQIEFSLALSRNRRVTKAIDSIEETQWTPVHYPGAVVDPDTGALIYDAEVAETDYTLSVRGHGRLSARLVVRRVKDARYPDGLFPVWRCHPFFTNSELPTWHRQGGFHEQNRRRHDDVAGRFRSRHARKYGGALPRSRRLAARGTGQGEHRSHGRGADGSQDLRDGW
jgi:hypothetical protein